MNIGIIVYSQTGNTLSVAQRIEKALNTSGHKVSIERLEIVSGGTNPLHKSVPDITHYDVLIFASPVHAFSLAPAMKNYLSQITDLTGKRIYCFVTQQLKKAWMGGNRAVGQIKSICEEKGQNVIYSGVVNWSSGLREEQIEDIVTKLSSI